MTVTPGKLVVKITGGQVTGTFTPASPTPPTPTPTPTPSRTLLGLWKDGTVSARSLGVTQDVLEVYGDPPNYATYSGPSSPRVMLATGFLSPGQAQAIASHCGPGVIWRPAWEFNQGTWFPNWNEASHAPSAWIAAFQSTVSAIRAADPRAVVIWNPNMGEGNNIKGYTTEQFYPGDAYVDWIGVDAYDFGGYGPNVQATINFAAAHGKPWSLPEWGLNGSDDTAYMHTMIGFIKNSPNCALQCYFSYPGPPNSDITQFPNCLAAYKAAF